MFLRYRNLVSRAKEIKIKILKVKKARDISYVPANIAQVEKRVAQEGFYGSGREKRIRK